MSSRLRLSLIAVALSFAVIQFNHLALAQRPAQEKLPGKTAEKTAEKPAPSPEKAPDYSQEAFVVEHLKTQFRFEKDGTGRREVSLRAKIQSDAGVQGFGQLVFPYSSANEKLEIDKVSVRKADGTVVTASASDVQDLTAPISREAPIYTDVRQKHVTVPGLRPGDTLEYHIIWNVHTPLAVNHFWLDHDFIKKNLIVLDEQLEVDIPLESTVKLKNEPGLNPVITEQSGRRHYVWKHANLKNEDKEDKEESERKNSNDDEPKPPAVQMTTFQSWGEVGQWYSALERDRVAPDEKIRAKAEELVRGKTVDKEKVEALYEFVAKNFRYVSLSLGQGRYQPHAASEVMVNQYGDCKDKHTLLSSMLIAAGLRAYPALMNSARKIDAEIPSPGQFDHVITAIPLAGETLWMDTTAEVAPFRLLSPPLRDKKALVIPTDAPAKLETTPATPPFLFTELLNVEGQVNEFGKLTGHSRMTLRGDTELFFRIMFRKTPKSQWKDLGYYLSAVGGGGLKVTEIKASEPAEFEKPFEVEYDLSDDSFLDWSSKKARLALPLPSVQLTNVDGRKESSKPIQLGPPIDVTYRLKLTLPAKYQTRIPLPLKVTRDYAEYSATYKLEGNSLIAERRFQRRQHELPADRTQDYIAFVAAVRSDEAQALSVETEVAGTPAIPGTVKVEELMEAAEAAAKSENYPLVEELLKRVLEKDPKQKTVRRQLAWALFAQQKNDAAIEMLREQTKINPFDDFSYNLLGRVYWQQQKYSDAEVAFRKQLEIAPLDRYAHSNLGQMLVEWRKYKEAVPELEQAISLDPEGESIYISLGRAYLNIGEPAKATEAFDKAVKLAPGPLVWNDVSYNLALGKLQLDKAQQYAESAVTATANDLRNLELSNLSRQDLTRVASIAAYWDTLGWVHYQKGDLDLAERYITAAWFLGQHSEVGAHLAEILEKRGKKEEAVRMYALAGVANRLVPEASEGLIRLAGKEQSVKLLEKAQEELRNARTVKLTSVHDEAKWTKEAQFYVVLAPGSSRTGEVVEVKFISGDEKLKPLTAALKAGNFGFVFPDNTATKIIRRGTLFCQSGKGECSFIMISPDSILSVD